VPPPQHNLSHHACGNGGDCRYDRPDKANCLPPGKERKKNT
jgi:hypothetical protein